MTRYHERYQAALRRGLSFDDAALIADGLSRGIGQARDWEPDCALLCCWGGAAVGDVEAGRRSDGPVLDASGLPYAPQKPWQRKGARNA